MNPARSLKALKSIADYIKQLNPWEIARLLPNCQRTIVGRFRSRSDADGQLHCLRQLIPDASFVVVFDSLSDMEALTPCAEKAEEVII